VKGETAESARDDKRALGPALNRCWTVAANCGGALSHLVDVSSIIGIQSTSAPRTVRKCMVRGAFLFPLRHAVLNPDAKHQIPYVTELTAHVRSLLSRAPVGRPLAHKASGTQILKPGFRHRIPYATGLTAHVRSLLSRAPVGRPSTCKAP
jgi:hypothetical protein